MTRNATNWLMKRVD